MTQDNPNIKVEVTQENEVSISTNLPAAQAINLLSTAIHEMSMEIIRQSSEQKEAVTEEAVTN